MGRKEKKKSGRMTPKWKREGRKGMEWNGREDVEIQFT
jgi:hypothetical protein